MNNLSKIIFNVAETIEFIFGWVEIIFEKGENVSYQHFLLFQKCF